MSTRTPAKRNQMFLALLTCLTSIVAVAALAQGLASTLEAISFVTGALCVWLVVRENVWNFPIGLVNVATFSVVFFNSQLYADAGLQVVYFVLGIVGWTLWLRGGRNRTSLSLSSIQSRESAWLVMFVLVSTIGLWKTVHHFGGSASFWDALTTAISLASQWMLNRKLIENWLGWIVVDIIYVPLYVSKGLYLTAILYAVFLCMAMIGWSQWHRTWSVQNASGRQ